MSDDLGGGWLRELKNAVHASPALKAEDAACRACLRVYGMTPARLARVLNRDVRAGLTFAHLRSALDFPAAPRVTDDPVDPVDQLLTRFVKTNLWAAWVAAFDAGEPVVARPGLGRRVLIGRGIGWGIVVAYDADDPPARAHVRVGHDVGRPLVIEPLTAWVRALSWDNPDRALET